MSDQTTVRLSTAEWERIVRLGTEQHAHDLTEELHRVTQRIAELETQYGMPFTRLQKEGLPDDAGLDAHEEYVEWSSLEGYVAELKERLAALQVMTAYAYAG